MCGTTNDIQTFVISYLILLLFVACITFAFTFHRVTQKMSHMVSELKSVPEV